MKRCLLFVMTVVMMLSVCLISFAEENTGADVNGIWIRQMDSVPELLIIYGSYCKSIIGAEERAYDTVLSDAMKPGVYYLILNSNYIFELTVSEDGNQLSVRPVTIGVDQAIVFSRVQIPEQN